MTTAQREAKMQNGPFELLTDIRQFLDDLLTDEEKALRIEIDAEPNHLPQAIAIGYYVLSSIMAKMGDL